MLVKHAIHSRRNKLVTVVQLSIPLLLTVLGCVVMKTLRVPSDYPPLTLSLSCFPSPVVPFITTDKFQRTESVVHSYLSVAGEFAHLHNASEAGSMDDYLLEVAGGSINKYELSYIVAAKVGCSGNSSDETVSVTSYFNNMALHALPISLALADNAVLQSVLPSQYR